MRAPDEITTLPPLLTTFRSLVWPSYPHNALEKYVGHLESKERLRIQPAQLFNFS